MAIAGTSPRSPVRRPVCLPETATPLPRIAGGVGVASTATVQVVQSTPSLPRQRGHSPQGRPFLVGVLTANSYDTSRNRSAAARNAWNASRKSRNRAANNSQRNRKNAALKGRGRAALNASRKSRNTRNASRKSRARCRRSCRLKFRSYRSPEPLQGGGNHKLSWLRTTS